MNSEALEPILEKMDQFAEDHRFESLGKLLDEAIRLARGSGSFGQYCYVLSRASSSCFATELVQQQFDWSVEAITLLEAMENARRIEPELEEDEFEFLRHEFIPDSYYRLALSTAKKQGFNSVGMQETVAEGIEKCYEVGAKEDAKYFQEYALDISIAADDLELAAKQAIQLTRHSKKEADDRRAMGWEALGRILLLMGDLEGALNAFQEGMIAALDNPDPRDIGTALHKFIEMTYILMGEGKKYAEYCQSAPKLEPMILNEHKRYSLLVEDVEACRAIVSGDYQRAKELRQKAIDFAEDTKALAPWFRARVQWLAVALLDEPSADFSKFIEETEGRAKTQRDWLTLRQLECLKNPEYSINPVVSVQPFRIGPFAGSDPELNTETVAESQRSSGEATKDSQDSEQSESDPEKSIEDLPPPAIESFFLSWAQRLDDHDEESDHEELLGELAEQLLDFPFESLDSERSAEYFLRCGRWAIHVDSAARKIWHCAKKLKKKFPEAGLILGLVAGIAESYQQSEAPEAHKPSLLEVEQLFEDALGQDIFNVQAYFDGGTFFARRGNSGKAERCFARAFRLDRTWSPAVLSLSQIYKATGRSRDALEVVDLAIRHGSTDEEVLWEAGLLAFQLESWQRSLSYFKRLLEVQTEAPFARYYCSVAHCELGEFQEGLAAIKNELKNNEEARFVAYSVKTWALFNLDRLDDARSELNAAVGFPLSKIESLSPRGLQQALLRLRNVALDLKDQESSKELLNKLFRHGLVDDELLETLEFNKGAVEEENLVWEVLLEQELPGDWSDDPDCLPWERDWKSYQVSWVVMATNEDKAKKLALDMQRRCADRPARVLGCPRLGEGSFHEKSMVLQQGPRDPARILAP